MKLIRKLKYPITIMLLITIVIYVIYIKFNLNKNSNIVENTEIIKTDNYEQPAENNIITKYNVDIKGAVNNPGVYLVDNNLTVNDVILIAGGLTENADTSVINLAKKISDEMVIIIYTKEEVKNSNVVDTVIKVVEKECVCPNIKNDSCLNTEIKDNITNSKDNNLVNINTATVEELQTLSGIGEAKAKNIISYREKNGEFKKIEDLMNVEGIGDALYETIKAYITT